MRAGRLAVAEPSGLGRVVVGRAGQGIGRDIQQIVGEGVDRRRKRRWVAGSSGSAATVR